MIQVQSRESIKLAYLVGDTADANTYYVRAVLRDSATGATISTAALAQTVGYSRRYTGAIQAPADNTGRGRWIDITITVYSDPTFATYVDTLPEQVFSYVVQDRISAALLAAGATSHDTGNYGPDIDYKRIQKMIADAARSLVETIKAEKVEMPELPKGIDEEALLTRFAGAITAYFDPRHEEVKGHIAGIGKKVEDVGRLLPELKAAMPDFAPVFDRFEKLGVTQGQVLDALGPTVLDMIERLLSKEFDSFTQSATVMIPSLVSRSQIPAGGSDDTGEPSSSSPRRRSVRDYHGDAMILLRKSPMTKK